MFIGSEQGRLDAGRLAGIGWAVSAITLGELRWGVLAAGGPSAAATRLSTYELASRFEPLPVDARVAELWALLVSQLRAAGKRVPVNDAWIAATALRHHCPWSPRTPTSTPSAGSR